MADTTSYKPIGGILRAELWHYSEQHTLQKLLATEAIEVTLSDDRSHYDESFSVRMSQVGVQQTLTLVASPQDAAPWLDREFQRLAAAEGLVARLHLASGEMLVAGWCSHLEGDASLRLKAVEYSSAQSPKQTPHVRLTLEGFSTESARENPLSNIAN